MSTEENKAIARRFFEEAFSQGNLAVLDEIVSPNHVSVGPGTPPGMPPGREGIKMLITAYRNAFPNLHFTIDEQIAEGNMVATRWSAHGTHEGELEGIPASGKSAIVVGIGTDRIEHRMIVESWGIFDQFGMLQQLGVLAAPSQT